MGMRANCLIPTSQLTESKRKKENLQVQIKALEQAEKQLKENEKEHVAVIERKHQDEVLSPCSSHLIVEVIDFPLGRLNPSRLSMRSG